MKSINREKFLSTLIQYTKISGLNKKCPVDILDIGEDLGITQTESLEIADDLVKLGIAEYVSLGNQMIQIK